MEKFVVQGSKKLKGEVDVLGAKNGILPLITASLLASKGKTVITNVPDFKDVSTLSQILRQMGVTVNYDYKSRVIEIECESIKNFTAPYELVKQMRASFLVIGPLLSRFKQAKISLPGGCAIGVRSVDMHIKALKIFGAKIIQEDGLITAKTEGLEGKKFYFDFPSHTGTENIMMAACLAKGKTKLINAACEPEIFQLAEMLNMMGAKIKGAGTPIIEIEGVKKMTAVEIEAISSRIETAFFMAVAAVSQSELVIKNVNLSNLEIVVDKMRQMGLIIKKNGSREIIVKTPKRLNPVDFVTWPFPGFPTDFQPQMMVLQVLSKGSSIAKETVFENRFMHVSELKRMGADIKTSLNEAFITGVKSLNGAPVMASDLQAGAGLVLAALSAEGESVIDRIYHIDRGYEKLEKRLTSLGASIKRINSIKS